MTTPEKRTTREARRKRRELVRLMTELDSMIIRLLTMPGAIGARAVLREATRPSCGEIPATERTVP